MKSLPLVLLNALWLSAATSTLADDPNRASQILTRELAQKILGTSVETSSTPALPDMELGATWVSRISYQAAAGGVAAPSISLLIRHAANLAEARPIFESSKETFHGEGVAGLGDAAYRTKVPAQLDVLKGGNWLIISAGTAKDPSAILQEKAAHEILAKMPN